MVLPNTSIINKPAMTRGLLSLAIASSLLLVGCNDDNDKIGFNNTPQHIASFTAAQIDQELEEASEIGKAVTPDAICGVTVEKISYQTKGSAGEATNATAALMLPSGSADKCQGDRPVLLHAHGTATEKNYDFTQVGNLDNPAGARSTLMAANFAAQGYIVVVPNYAGYDTSTLDYHPYLNKKQQSEEMVTALDTARDLIKQQQAANNANYVNVKDSGKLFLTGYSQGGHVAMAAAQLLQEQGKPVTAIAPSSGPYALAAFGDAIVSGNVNVGATAFVPLLARSLQNVDGKIYRNPTEIFTNKYAETTLPNDLTYETLIRTGKLPQTALFEGDAEEDGFGFAAENYLIQTSFRAAYLADVQANPDSLIAGTGVLPAENPQNELRKALKANDLRSYIPNMPTLICGGNQDPTVFFDLNTGSMAAILQQAAKQNQNTNLNVTVLDVDATNADDRDQNTVTSIGSALDNPWMLTSAITDVQTKFTGTVDQVSTTAYTKAYTKAYQKALADDKTAAQADLLAVKAGEDAAQVAVLSTYHAGLVSTACTNATRQFFDQTFAQS